MTRTLPFSLLGTFCFTSPPIPTQPPAPDPSPSPPPPPRPGQISEVHVKTKILLPVNSGALVGLFSVL